MKNLFLTLIAISVATVSAKAIKTTELKWHDASNLPVLGTLAPDASKEYSRLPDSLESQIRPDLWNLGKNSAGMSIRFRSDATAIGMQWTAMNKFNMNHMTAAGIRGLDLYALDDDGQWKTVSSARPLFHEKKTKTMVVTDMPRKMREYMLYLPLYDGVDSIFIGTDSLASVLPPAVDSPVKDKPVVVYGTSIVQGGCASRPGMVHTSILQRRLNRDFINLGFSGNAKLDPEIARLIADNAPSVIVLDPLPNCKKEELEERLFNFYQIIREKHPATPILFVESCVFPIMKWNTETNETITEKNNTLKRLYAQIAANDSNVYYFEGDKILSDREGTVDNYHLTDLGFTDFANNLYPVLKELLDKSSESKY